VGSWLEPLSESSHDGYDVLGVLGSAADGARAYLARERTTSELVALCVGPGGEASVAVARTLSSIVPADNRSCPVCQAPIGDWRRYCSQCGADFSGIEARSDDPATAAQEGEQNAQERFEVLGHLPRSEGGDAVYFGRERGSGRIVALGPQQSEPRAAPTGASGKICPTCSVEYDDRIRFCPEDGSVLRSKAGSDDLVGAVIERYHVLRLLGQGGMGRVYLAQHVRMGRQCAIKVLNRAVSSDSAAINRFAREAANASRINHINVAHIYDFGESAEHGIYLAMEYVDGEPLGELIAREAPFSAARAVHIAKQVANALEAAHLQEVVHRDLTPNNIVIARTHDGAELVKVVDFGIAKTTKQSGASLTRTGFVIGTPKYMSPEQLIGERVDGRSDLYALGCTMFEMLTGEHPFGRLEGPEQITRRLTEAPPRARTLNASVPAQLDEVVARLLARDARDRYQNPAELRRALAAVPTENTTLDVASAIAQPLPVSPAQPKRERRFNVLPVAGGVTATLLAGALIWWAVQSAPTQTAETDSLQVADSLQQKATGSASTISAQSDAKREAPPQRVSDTTAVDPPATEASNRNTVLRLTVALPNGAVIRANGAPLQIRQNRVVLPEGTHRIVLSAPGYLTVERTFELEGGGELNWAPTLVRRNPTADAGDGATRSAGGGATPRDSNGTPPASNAALPPRSIHAFDAAARAELDRFAGLIGQRRMSEVRLITTLQIATDINTILYQAGTADISVLVDQLRADSSAHTAQFRLAIRDASSQRVLLAWTPFEATFIKTRSGWALAFVNRRATQNPYNR
jgi:serine/threonine-protein kinase